LRPAAGDWPRTGRPSGATSEQIIVAAEITTKGGDSEELDPMISAGERELATAGVAEPPGVVLVARNGT
jgi:hypothetical protein